MSKKPGVILKFYFCFLNHLSFTSLLHFLIITYLLNATLVLILLWSKLSKSIFRPNLFVNVLFSPASTDLTFNLLKLPFCFRLWNDRNVCFLFCFFLIIFFWDPYTMFEPQNNYLQNNSKESNLDGCYGEQWNMRLVFWLTIFLEHLYVQYLYNTDVSTRK